MEYIIGILILASFFGLAIYAARGGNLMMGMLIMAILWTILPMTGNLLASNPDFIAANGDSIRITWIQAFSKVFQSGPEGWGSVLVNVVFGAWFGRVLLETGIAATLIRKTTELGGDKPAITCILLCIVTAAIFSSLFGAGAVVAIGVIILGWGIVQVGMSIQSHDASQRTQGILCVFGGLIIAFAKEILSAIGVA